MSKQVKPGLYELEWSEEEEESIFSLTDDEIEEMERQVLESGLEVLLPTVNGLERTERPQAVSSKDD